MSGNYDAKLLRLHAEGKMPPPGLWHAVVAHDDWCGALKQPPAECDCDPDIRFLDVDGNPWKGDAAS